MKARESVEQPEDRRVGFKMLGRTEEEGLELRTEEFDFYLRKGRAEWWVDIFRADVPDHERAHVESEGFPTLGEALRFIGNRSGGGGRATGAVDALRDWDPGRDLWRL